MSSLTLEHQAYHQIHSSLATHIYDQNSTKEMADELAKFMGGSLPKHMGYGVTKEHRTKPTAIIDPTNNTLPDGYVAVVTGGAQGIGRFIGRAYVLAKASGVIITGRRAGPLDETKAELEKLASEDGHKAKISVVVGDAEQHEVYVQIREMIEKEYNGRLDALICNAGPGGNGDQTASSPQYENTSDNAFHSLMNVNVNGPFYAMKELVPLLLKGEGKTLVNIVSAVAHSLNLAPWGYCLAKFTECRLTEQIAASYADKGLVAVALHPGGVVTPSTERDVPKEMHGSKLNIAEKEE